jgi:hypothetical protein
LAVKVVVPTEAPPVKVNEAVVCPAGIVTELGLTLTNDEFATLRKIVAPPVGAG